MDLFGPMTAKAIHVNARSMYVTAKLAVAQSRMLEQCLGFRSERYATGNAGEIERLDAQPIACEHKPTATRVPQSRPRSSYRWTRTSVSEWSGRTGARRAAALLAAPRNCRSRR